MRRYLLILALLLLAAGCATNPQPRTARYTNPVYNHDAPDPTVIRAADGLFYAYTTQTEEGGRTQLYPILKSADLVSWTKVGTVFTELPPWASHDFWAPHITLRGGKYYLYYAAKHRETGAHTIGVAVADSPAGPFRDKGSPLLTISNPSTIDPFVLDDGGKLYLYWGSDRVPLLVQELAADGLSPVGEPQPVLFPSEAAEGYERLVEGPWVIKRQEYYYLFYSGDDCCDRPHYAVLVARSKSPLGPFAKNPANPVLAANERWTGPGHNAIIQDDAGVDWYLYHAFDQQNRKLGRVLLLDRITWQADGWPARITPSTSQTDGPTVKRK